MAVCIHKIFRYHHSAVTEVFLHLQLILGEEEKGADFY